MKKRLFVAINLDNAAKLALAKIVAQLPDSPAFKKTRIDNQHLTLQFLGDTEEELIPQIQGILNNTATRYPALKLSFTQLGAFPNWQQPNIIWIGLDGSHLKDLQVELARQLIKIVPTMDTKPFKPHLTLARIKSPLNQSTLNVLQTLKNNPLLPAPTQILHIDLMSSTLTPQGANHVYISSHRFSG